MDLSKKNKRFDNYLLKGKLRRNGFERWRYVFTGIDRATGNQKTFFIELYYVNPLLSPKEPVIAQKSQLKLSNAQLQYALAGTLAAESAAEEVSFIPSYALVKAGVFGTDGKQINSFRASGNLSFVKSEQIFKIENCSFGCDLICGQIEVSDEELRKKPELLCSTGKIKWNLHFEKNIESPVLCNTKETVFVPLGVKTVFAGSVELDDVEYTVVPRSSCGYVDKSWGSEPLNPYFHLSSSNITSSISGKTLAKSAFCVEGEFDKRLSIFVEIEGKRFVFAGNSVFNRYTEIHSCTQMPADSEGEKLHWSVSIHRKKIVIDIDIFARTSQMLVRDYELPEGGKKLLKVLGGGNGYGEIKIFKKVKKNLELLEHANILDAVCDFGSVDCAEDERKGL